MNREKLFEMAEITREAIENQMNQLIEGDASGLSAIATLSMANLTISTLKGELEKIYALNQRE